MVAEDDDEASKTEEPSERKISKAKEEGDIAISQDAKSFIMLIGMLFIIWLVLPLMFKWFYTYSLKFVETPDTIPTDGRHIRLLLYDTVFALMKILGIPFAILMVLGIFASIAQTGFVFAPKKLEPNWNKLNIFAALPQFINMKKIVESLKGIIKITVIAFIGILVIRPYLEKVNLMPGMETMAILSFIHKVVVLLIFTVVIAVLVIAVADFAYQKYQHLKKLRMSQIAHPSSAHGARPPPHDGCRSPRRRGYCQPDALRRSAGIQNGKDGCAGRRCQRFGQSGAAHQGNSRRTRHSHCRKPAAGACALRFRRTGSIDSGRTFQGRCRGNWICYAA